MKKISTAILALVLCLSMLAVNACAPSEEESQTLAQESVQEESQKMKVTKLITIYRNAQAQAQQERMENGRDTLFTENVCQETDLAYLDDGSSRHLLDVYSPEGEEETLPVIVEIHGGGYVANEKDVTAIHARYLATKGFRVVNADYTLWPEADFGEELSEIAEILNWVYENREVYHFDTDRIYLTGDSAGGHLILLYAMMQGSPEMQEYFKVTMPKVSVRAVAASCPAFRFRLDASKGDNDGMNFIYNMVFPDGASEELLDMLDVPLQAKSSQYPPIFLSLAPQDDLLYEEDLKLVEELEAIGRPLEVNICTPKNHELTHSFNVTSPEWEESIEANDKICEFFMTH